MAAHLFDAFTKLNILVVGDVMIDRYLSGRVDRVSPEAPVPVVAFEEEENRLGGAANVALNIRALGATPILCSVIGEDANAREFRDLLPGSDLTAAGIISSPTRRTTVKTRVMAGDQQLLRVDREDTHDLAGSEADQLVDGIRGLLDRKSIQLILFQDYNKGVLTEELIETVIGEARRRKIPTAVDPKFRNFFAYRYVTLFKPNLKEVRAQVPMDGRVDLDTLNRASAYLRDRLQHRHTLITLSDQGLYYDDEGRQAIIPTQPRSIADVCGAGDTVISIAALGLALGLDMGKIAVLANLAGGQVCERVGVVPVNKEQLRAEYEAIHSPVAPAPPRGS